MRDARRLGVAALGCALAATPLAPLRAQTVGSAGAHVVELRHDTPAVGVCVASHRDLPALPPELSRQLLVRGGAQDDSPNPWTRCLAVSTGEIALGLWAARGWLDPPSADVDVGVDAEARARGRLEELAGAGSPHDGAPVLVLVGSAERLVGGSSPVHDATRTPTVPQRSERLSVLEDARVATPQLWVGYATTGASATEGAALGLIAEMLGAPRSGRISRLLVRGRHRASGASASAECVRGTPLLVVHVAVTAHSSVDRVDRYVVSTVKQLRIEGPSEREMIVARRALETRLLRGAERPVDRARQAADQILCGRSASLEEQLARAAAVTAADVHAAARRFLLPTRRNLVEVYPPGWPQDDESLRAYRLHTVREGETWDDVATLYDVPAARIASANELHTRYRLGPGQVLWVPPAKPEPTEAGAPDQAASAPSAPSRR